MPKLVKFEYRAIEWSLLVLLGLITVSVVARYVFNHAIGELFELMIFGSVAFYWLAMATAEREGAHLGVGFGVAALPAGLRRIASLVRIAVIAIFLAVIVYSGSLLVLSQFRLGMASGLLHIPLWIFSIFMPFGAVLMLIRALRSHAMQARTAVL
jgi:TRAP-type C4-dicarboxylate transport system permease small subunit